MDEYEYASLQMPIEISFLKEYFANERNLVEEAASSSMAMPLVNNVKKAREALQVNLGEGKIAGKFVG